VNPTLKTKDFVRDKSTRDSVV